MRQINFVFGANNSITAFANNKQYGPFAMDHPGYLAIKEAVKNDDIAALDRVGNVAQHVENYTGNRVQVRDGIIYFENEPLHNSMTERILMLMREGFKFDFMLKFLENLMENTSMKSVEELYDFLAHQNLPITEDGYFLAYKRVKDDWTDMHTGKFDNRVGCKLSMPRNKVDDNRSVDCSYGFHVGAIEYVRTFGSGGHVVICKVNPRDAVSVPQDHNCTKLRVCAYEVIGEYSGDLVSSVYTPEGSPSSPTNFDEDYENDSLYDEDDEDEDEVVEEDFDDEDDEDEDEVIDMVTEHGKTPQDETPPNAVRKEPPPGGWTQTSPDWRDFQW